MTPGVPSGPAWVRCPPCPPALWSKQPDSRCSRWPLYICSKLAALLTESEEIVRIVVIVLGGELAVPCTRNPLQRGRIPCSRPGSAATAGRFDNEGRVLRGGALRTPSGPEGSSGKQQASGAVEQPGRSRVAPVRRVNHGRQHGARSPGIIRVAGLRSGHLVIAASEDRRSARSLPPRSVELLHRSPVR